MKLFVSTPGAISLCVAALFGYLAGRSPPSLQKGYLSPSPSVDDNLSNPRQTIFDELTAAETRAVVKYVVDKLGVKTSMYPNGTAAGDYISGTSAVELIAPEKAAALAYVDGITDVRPLRYARVTVVRGSKLDVMEYKVGPLHGCDVNACDDAYVEGGSPLIPLVAPGAIPFEKRPMDMADPTPMQFAETVFLPLKELLLSSFGPIFSDDFYPGCGTACYSGEAGSLFPFAFNDILSTSTLRVSKLQFFWYKDWSNFEAIWLHGIPFTYRIAQVGVDVRDWYLFDIFYCGQGPFKSAADLLAANPTRCTYKPDPALNGQKGAWDIPGPDLAHRQRPTLPSEPPPKPRYTLAGAAGGNGRLVEWAGWSFFATLRPSTGLAAMDIKFKGVRVAHELALAEAAAHYSGTGADQVFYLDAAFSMSQMGGDLKVGLDCPTHATYLDAVLWVEAHEAGGSLDSDVSRARPYRAFCIFEENSEASNWRHLQLMDKRVDGIPSSALVVRAVTAVGNYDYITEYRFNLDGSIRVKFDFAGYMETRWFGQEVTPWERSLGEVVHDNLIAPLHSHFGCFKVDLDQPAGESLEVTAIKAGLKPDVPDLRGFATKYVERSIVGREGIGVSTFVSSSTAPTTFAIVDNTPSPLDDKTPTSKPGYLIKPGPTVGQMLPDEHPFVKASAFSKYTLAVTARKEAEYRPTSVYDLFGPGEPYTSLDTFLDGDSLEQKDLVAWVNLGKEHLPRTEDLPLITNFGTYFDILPRNIHPVNAAMDVYVSGD